MLVIGEIPLPEVWVSAMQMTPSGSLEKFWCSMVCVEGIEAVTNKVCPRVLLRRAAAYLLAEN